MLSIIGSESERDSKAVVEVASFLNHFELVAVAIKHRIINEDLYAEWLRTKYVQTWEDAEAFIVAMCKEGKHERLFREFEALAKKWKVLIGQ